MFWAANEKGYRNRDIPPKTMGYRAKKEHTGAKNKPYGIRFACAVFSFFSSPTRERAGRTVSLPMLFLFAAGTIVKPMRRAVKRHVPENA